jgi:histidinol phosphatase-like PHP family hydrolase
MEVAKNMPHVLEKANLTAGALLCLCAMAVLNATAQDTPRYSLREMDMHIHCGLERRLPLNQWIDLSVADGRKVLFCLDHIELYDRTPKEYGEWAREEGVQQWYPMGREGHRAFIADIGTLAAARKDLLVFKGWEVAEFDLDDGVNYEPLKDAQIIGWHISSTHEGDEPNGALLIRRIKQVIEAQNKLDVPMILFHPFPARLGRMEKLAKKAGRTRESLTVDELRFFKPGQQEEVIRLLKDKSIYIEMGSGTEGYWDTPNTREALIADIKPLADGGVKFTVSTDAHTPDTFKKPIHPEVYCEPCGITAENANAIIRDLLTRQKKLSAPLLYRD